MTAFEAADDAVDAALCRRAVDGDAAALTELVARHQRWFYHVALRLVLSPADAEDLAQETVVRIVTHLSSFGGRSSFRTWAYRILKNAFLDGQRRPMERAITTFAAYGAELDALPDAEPASGGPEQNVLVQEAMVGCTLGMLLCLDREQRLVYVLGAIVEAPGAVAAEILEIRPAAYRKRLERARADLAAFMDGQCGLVNPSNPCRCHRKTKAFVEAGWVDPDRLKFVDRHVERLRDAMDDANLAIDDVERRAVTLFRAHPDRPGPDLADRLAQLVADPGLRDRLGLASPEA